MGREAVLSEYTKEELDFWELIKSKEGTTYYTLSGLPFAFTVKGNELFVDRKAKSITISSVIKAYRVAKEMKVITGPKKLESFGASYLYPIFLDLGICVSKTEE